MMRISVVVPVYNGERFLAEAIDSVLAQTRHPDEIIVIDDGSTDGSVALLERYPEVRLARQPNAGCAAARNRGVALATGEAIAFLDQDDLWQPERLARQADALERRPELGFVVCAQENFLTPSMNEPPAWLDPRMLDTAQHGFGTNSLMVRREAFERVGVFDSSKVPIDDTDWFVRALDAGIGYLHLDQVLVRRRIHDSNLTGQVRGTPRGTALMARVLHDSLKRRRNVGEQV
jgi:glycosyltransferase involved in cell wall biosynthesis